MLRLLCIGLQRLKCTKVVKRPCVSVCYKQLEIGRE